MITATPRRPAGRPPGPTKLNPQLMERVFELVRTGVSLESVAFLVGIHPTTFFRWMREGRDATDGPYYEFFMGVKRSLASCELYCLEQLQTDRRWRRWAWILERKFPNRWGRRPRRIPERREESSRTIEEMIAEMHQRLGTDPDSDSSMPT